MDNKRKKMLIHYVIGLAIMILGRFIPLGILPGITEIGLQVVGVFVGTLYLWTTIDPTVASLTSVFMLAFTDYGTTAAVFATCFGNVTVVQLMFLMMFMGGLTHRKLTLYIARWLMTRKFIEGRPWAFTAIILYGTFLMATFIGCFAPIFLFWPVLYGVYDDVGFKKTDVYPKVMTLAVVVCALVGFPVPPYMSNGLALLGNYRGLIPNFPALAAMDGVMISDASYFIACFLMGLLLVTVVILVMKFIFRPDVSPLKEITVEMLEKNPLPPMSLSQRIYGVFLCIFIFVMLVPSLLPNVPILSFLNANAYAMPMVLCVILALLPAEDGSVLKLEEVMGRHFGWPTYFLCTSAILLGGVLTNESTGITSFLNTVLSPVFNGMSGTVFTIVLMILLVLLTNICNSLVIGMIMQPVALTYCTNAGINPAPIITMLIFTVLLSAACTPAASPFAAMLFGNKEYLTAKDIYKYSTTFVVIELIVILVIGTPVFNTIM